MSGVFTRQISWRGSNSFSKYGHVLDCVEWPLVFETSDLMAVRFTAMVKQMIPMQAKGHPMNSETGAAQTPVEGTGNAVRRAWHPPTIRDADISALTNGGGTSGMEGTNFLKPGS